jgi:hypothetical protein
MRSQTRRALGALTLGAAMLAAARHTAMKQGGGFLVTLGKDTVAAETWVIMDNGVQTGTQMARRTARVVTSYYTLELDKSGNLAKYEVAAYAPGQEPPNGHPIVHSIWTPMGDALHEVVHTDSAHELHLVTPPNTLPFMDLGFGMWQVLTRRLAASGKDSIVVPMFFVNDTTHYTTIVKRVGKDSAVITSEYGVGRAKIDAHGLILGYDAPGSTTQVVATVVKNLDVKALAAAFAQRPAIGRLSPADTVRASVGAAHVWVAYSRPSMRGRVIFGDVVPWNVWWRTGANAATTFVTDKDLVIGGTTVPAGEYTLFSLPNPSDWKLIISKLTKEWGTDYDPTKDLVRVPMTVSALSAPMELMTIAITPQGDGAVLTVSWEKTAASVMMQAK